MNLLDIRTVFLSSIISTLICTIIVASLWQQNRRRYQGLSFWVGACILQWLAVVAIVLRPALPDLVSILLGIPLFLLGMYSLYIGLERFLGQTTAQSHNWLILTSFLFIHVFFTTAHPSMLARNINLSAALIVVSIQCAWLLLRRVDAAARPTTRMAGVVFCVYALVSAARIVAELAVPPNTDFFKSGLYDALALLAYQMLFIALTLALSLMVNRRLTAEMERDIIERQRAEDALRQSEEKFSLAFMTSPYGITITRLSDGKFLEVNSAFEAMTGFTRAEALASSSINLMLWANPEDRQSVVADLRSGREVVAREFRFNTKTGAAFTGLFSCRAFVLAGEACALSSINDITELKKHEDDLRAAHHESARLLAEAQESRQALLGVVEHQKEAEASLRASEERFRRAVVDAPFPILLHAEDGAIILGSQSWCDITGYTWEELATIDDWIRLACGELSPIMKADINALYGMEHQKHQGDHTIRTRDGGTRIWEFSSAPLGRLPDGRRLVISMAMDVTERRQAEAKLRKQLDELQRWHDATLGRERRVQELKREINRLLAAAGQPPRFSSVSSEGEE